jgi:cytidylate kinase
MSLMKSFVIAIDGPNASGKGTLARRLGKELGFPVLDTGLLYRAVGWIVRQKGNDLHDEKATLKAADELRELPGLEFLDNPDLRSVESSNAASIVSAHPSVRQALFDFQRGFALNPPGGAKGAILDGRDIGTVICPDADLKLYVTAAPEIRAERRARELYGTNWEINFEALLTQTHERDHRDSTRAVAPLRPAEDSIMIDTSFSSADQTFAKALEIIKASPRFGEKNASVQ